MGDIIKTKAAVISQEQLTDGIYSMYLMAPSIARKAAAGQFISLYSGDRSRLLPRPISICQTDAEGGRVRIVYRIAGAGTDEFSRRVPGDEIDVMGPLGNGYEARIEREGRRITDDTVSIITGGGIGIPPMLQLASQLKGRKIIVLGYKDQLFLNKEFEKYGQVYISTEDGSAGTKGNILDAIREHDISGDYIFRCGPTPMLRAVKAFAAEKGMTAYLSLEERMACGIGACLGCVCTTKEKDSHSNVKNARVCKDGPVFNASEVEI